METLEVLAERVRNCSDCPLHATRTNAVPGEGPPDAELLFIGEGPGFHEDRQGRPFVGPAGRFLEELLLSIGMTREQVYIANMVKCRPPDNRDPAPSEIAACSKYLDRQIELINPLMIVTLGRFSMTRFLPGQSISRARGVLRMAAGRRVFPIMHPAAGLRRQEMRDAIEQDFAKVPGLLDVLRMDVAPASTPTPAPAVPEPAVPEPAVPEPAAEYAADPEPPSLWNPPPDDSPPNAGADANADPDANAHPPATPAAPAEPTVHQPPPGQQRLF